MQFLSLLAFIAACAASPITSQAALKPYVKPKSSDSRGPCPLLNTLANHGYLPHDGRNITVQDIGNAIFDSTNWHSDFGTLPAKFAFQGLGLSSIKLSDLNNPKGGEHPASLTRKDASSGDSNTIDTTRVAQFLADSKPNFLTVESLAKTRNRLDTTSNPLPTTQEISVGQGEGALLLLLMRDTYVRTDNISTIRAPKDRTRVWLLEERFPTAQGWQPAKETVLLSDTAPISAAIVDSQAVQRGSS
ncbi:putative chloroperoxidase [Xylaria bambusicola]|uniref:putative chloroperoxidase n=1 Tax=Xylaria bambusicola TaxID=326684 RepID=UPI002008C81A|nr:putative chloroperoxidase [Xylaria bambusicola]KAI0521617.1 putative chloroperoxidase [Xylaria bambusicola]